MLNKRKIQFIDSNLPDVMYSFQKRLFAISGPRRINKRLKLTVIIEK